MSAQRRTALVSIVAACVLIGVKLVAGIASGSLGLLSEAAHSGTDLIAALLTFVAVGVAGRPADPGHAYGHGKAEHLAALAEAAILVVLSLAISWQALLRLFGVGHGQVDPRWYTLVVVAVVMVVDATRAIVSYRTGRRYGSAALQANALHFASDLAGSGAVMLGLIAAQAGRRQFADVVIGVPPGAAVGQGHAAADAVEEAVHGALPESDVVVHVEPQQDEAVLGERVLAAAQRVPRVREIHNLTVLRVGPVIEASLHLKLPGELPLEEAHAVASEVERAIVESVPEVDAVQTHLEPLAEAGEGRSVNEAGADRELVERIVRATTGEGPRELRFLRTDRGLLAYLTLGLDASTSLAQAHARASDVEERIRRERPDIADVIVHTEP